jgi:hypothetical protein
MRRESHVRFCEGGGVRFPSATRLVRSIKEECLDRLIPDRGGALPARRRGVRRALPHRTESPGHCQSPDLRPVTDPDDESRATSAAPRRAPQFL